MVKICVCVCIYIYMCTTIWLCVFLYKGHIGTSLWFCGRKEGLLGLSMLAGIARSAQQDLSMAWPWACCAHQDPPSTLK